MIRIWRELAPSCKVNIYSKITVGSPTGEEEKEEGEEGEGPRRERFLLVEARSWRLQGGLCREMGWALQGMEPWNPRVENSQE